MSYFVEKRKNVIFAEKFEKSSKKRKELERNQVTKLKEEFENYEQRRF